jgi:hypothetical protein
MKEEDLYEEDFYAPTTCRVFWGSHGCDKPRGHRGRHLCQSCGSWWERLLPWRLRLRWTGYVGAYPYYGPETQFYGEDAKLPSRKAGHAK